MAVTYLLAHLTDPHVGPLPRPRVRELLSKRATGWANWRRGRKTAHDMEVLAELVADIHDNAPGHIACTGDLCNIGLKSEWETARVFLEAVGDPDAVSLVPGNHDAYVRGALEGLMRTCGPWTRGEDGLEGHFPYLRRRGPLAIVGLSSATPTAPFVATGRLGSRQIAAAEALLAGLATARDVCRVVLVHHPPHVGGAPSGRNLTDARAFEAMIGRVGADLVLHGHNHTGSVAFLVGPDGGRVAVIGAPSASARGGLLTHRAGYHLFAFAPREEDGRVVGYTVTARLRGLLADGSFGDLATLVLGG